MLRLALSVEAEEVCEHQEHDEHENPGRDRNMDTVQTAEQADPHRRSQPQPCERRIRPFPSSRHNDIPHPALKIEVLRPPRRSMPLLRPSRFRPDRRTSEAVASVGLNPDLPPFQSEVGVRPLAEKLEPILAADVMSFWIATSFIGPRSLLGTEALLSSAEFGFGICPGRSQVGEYLGLLCGNVLRRPSTGDFLQLTGGGL